MNNFCVVQILILFAPLVQCACHAENELYFFKIDLEDDYESQRGDGWAVNLAYGNWIYHDTWPGLDGTGIFEINTYTGMPGQWFELTAWFSDYDQPQHYFEFEMKFYNQYMATLQDVVVDGEYEETIYLDTSTELQWSIIKFSREGGPFLPPNLPRLMVRIPSDSSVFLMESLTTKICDSLIPTTSTTLPETTTAPPNTTMITPETTTVPPETTTARPETTTVPPETTTAPPETTPPPTCTCTCTITVPCCATGP